MFPWLESEEESDDEGGCPDRFHPRDPILVSQHEMGEKHDHDGRAVQDGVEQSHGDRAQGEEDQVEPDSAEEGRQRDPPVQLPLLRRILGIHAKQTSVASSDEEEERKLVIGREKKF